jgi:hypothetical protein
MFAGFPDELLILSCGAELIKLNDCPTGEREIGKKYGRSISMSSVFRANGLSDNALTDKKCLNAITT